MGASGFSPEGIAVVVTAAFLVGLRRGGLNGAAMLGIIVLVSHFEPPLSVGLGVVISIFSDIQATVVLFRDVDWRTLGSLLIPTLIGLAAGAWVGTLFSTVVFEWIMFFVILLAYVTMIVHRMNRARGHAPPVPGFITPIAGFMSGVASMIGNLASIFVSVFFAARGATKANFIATSIWYFFVLNIVKIPVHFFVWNSLTVELLIRMLFVLPVAAIGIWTGRRIVARLSEVVYWRMVVIVAGLATLRYLYVLVS